MRDEGDGREGGMASILRVRPVGKPAGDSQAEAGTLLALKLAREDEPLSTEALHRETEVFVTLRGAQGMPPCPRLHDVIASARDADRVIALVMEWCPHDMERWWAEVHGRPWAFSELCEALAEVCQRLVEYQRTCAASAGQRVAHSDVKPRNLLRAQDARWLLTDFGAAKARDIAAGDWSATRVILGTESFIAPEGLFNARKAQPEAMDIWSVGATFYALLRMHAHLRDGGRMPLNGTHSSQFRSHRVALVSDLHQRKPALFIDKPLDATQFASHDRLPDKDRTAIADALKQSFAEDHQAVVIEATIVLIERAMQVDPAARFPDASQMGEALVALSRLARVDVGLDATRVLRAADMGAGALEALRAGPKSKAPDYVLPRLDTNDLEEMGPPSDVPGLPENDLDEIAPDATGVRALAPPPPEPVKPTRSAKEAKTAPSPDPTVSVVVPRGPGASAAPASPPLVAATTPAAPVPAPQPVNRAAGRASSPPTTPAAEAGKPATPSSPKASSPPTSSPPATTDEAERAKVVLVGGNARPAPLTIARGAADEPAPEPSETRMKAPPAPPAVPRDARPEGVRMSKRIAPRLPGWLAVGIAVIVCLQLISIGLQITELLITARHESAAVAAPPATVSPRPLPPAR